MAYRTFKRPNILLIYTDQQRQDSLGCYGSKHAITPNLDKLAQEGMRFDKYFVNNPVCMPSRMAMLTGRYCSSLGVGTNGIPIPDSAVSIQQMVKPYGYNTAQIGKLHFQPHARRDHRDPHPSYGFDTFILSDEPGCYDDAYTKWVESIAPEQVSKVRTALPPAALEVGRPVYSEVGRDTHEPYTFEGDEDLTHSAFVASETCRYLETADKNKPFFAIAGFYAPHTPVNPPKKFIDMYNPDMLPLPVKGVDEPWSKILEHLNEKDWRKIVAYYLALVSHVDDCVGRILDTLDKQGLADDTLVIFTSDHGEYLGDHGRIQKGMPGHDCIVNVPLIIRHPGKISKGTSTDAMVEGVDIVPTILEWCGIQVPSFVQGSSIKNLLLGETDTHREDILIEFFEPFGKKETTLRTDRFKYYLNSYGEELLYDLEIDPKELVNAIAFPEFQETISKLRLRMLLRIQEAAYPSIEKTALY